MLLKSIYLENLLSYSTGMERLELGPLNVLIGPNASGKSNLIEAISLLAAAPRNLLTTIRDGGGIGEWLWKGGPTGKSPTALIDATFSSPPGGKTNNPNLNYQLSFTANQGHLKIIDEKIVAAPTGGRKKAATYYSYQYKEGYSALSLADHHKRKEILLPHNDISQDQSVLSQHRSMTMYPELTYLATQLEQIHCYRQWHFGRYTNFRVPQRADLPDDFLLENAHNLGLVVNNLQNRPATKKRLLELLQKFYAELEDITTRTQGNTISIFCHETGLQDPIPATQLSDGILRYLGLLTILCHPEPPPLICLEEPELGMHPDSLVTIARLITECVEEQRTQLIITTHSEMLVDALTDMPEAVIVCEKHGTQGTQLKRLKPKELEVWLADCSLGQLWTQGEIGGNRW